tara:strand:- start:970 stop:1170 length:201 start_codon:yes stop_codon:yes gene_type:complete
MIYTIIHEDQNGSLGVFTFASTHHNKNYAWAEFTKRYAEEGQKVIGIMPGNQLVYFSPDISFTNIA